MTTVRVIFPDQLSRNLATLNDAEPGKDTLLFIECADEFRNVPHHKHKLILLFSAMRHFSQELSDFGYKIGYLKLSQTQSCQSYTQVMADYLKKHRIEKIILTEPSEYDCLQQVKKWQSSFAVPCEIRRDKRFYCSKDQFAAWADQHKQLRMESFYRWQRKKTGLLMKAGKPVGGQWNFDQSNRKPYDGSIEIPQRTQHRADEITQAVQKAVAQFFPDHFGEVDTFNYAVTRRSALAALRKFINECLPYFGHFQDAMVKGQGFLFHAVLSPYINCGLLLPDEVCQAAQQAYQDGLVPINAVEGFIRQILGWREFIRGIYWYAMPDYKEKNFFNAENNLPVFYWTADTNMACVQHAVQQTLDTAYSHHIQRLMVTGNLALLLGVDIQQICDWYLAVYADAFDWVELPNTLGMSMFADGGLFASKPYCSSGNYINKMSDFCRDCTYKVKQRTGDDACPFNYLYWDFLSRNSAKLRNNQRLGFAYKNLDRFSEAERKAIRASAQKFIAAHCSDQDV